MRRFQEPRPHCDLCGKQLNRNNRRLLCRECYGRHVCIICDLVKLGDVVGHWCRSCKTDSAFQDGLRKQLGRVRPPRHLLGQLLAAIAARIAAEEARTTARAA